MSVDRRSAALGVVIVAFSVAFTWFAAKRSMTSKFPPELLEQTKATGDSVVGLIGDKEKIASSELLDGELVSELNRMAIQTYQLRKGKLDEVLSDRLFKREAGKTDLAEWTKKNIDSKSRTPTPAEIDQFVKEQVGQMPTDPARAAQLKERVIDFLKMQNAQEVRASMLEKLKKKYRVSTGLRPELKAVPNASVISEKAPTQGDLKAKVSVIEFSDFECPFCERAMKTFNQLKGHYKGKSVVFQFRHFPLPNHTRAEPASIASVCADRQGKFWGMHDLLFNNQRALSDDDLKKHAGKVGLNAAKFSECLSDPTARELVQADLQAGRSFGIKSTPTFVINGKPIAGALPFELFTDIIDAELQ